MRYKLIDTNKAAMPVERMYRMMAGSVSGYYAWKDRKPSLHQCYDVVLAANIKAQFVSSNQTCGAPRMHAELCEEGLSVGRHRMAKQFASYERNQSVVLESLATFIRYYLTLTAATPKAEQDASRIIGNQRFEAFVAQVGKRIAGGISSMDEAMEKTSMQEPDLKQRDPDKSLMEETHNAQ
jgi:hypothetical protein